MILGTILKHVRVKRPQGTVDVEWEAGVTLRPDRALELVLEPRNPSAGTNSTKASDAIVSALAEEV